MTKTTLNRVRIVYDLIEDRECEYRDGNWKCGKCIVCQAEKTVCRFFKVRWNKFGENFNWPRDCAVCKQRIVGKVYHNPILDKYVDKDCFNVLLTAGGKLK